jgi:hypothetical protein
LDRLTSALTSSAGVFAKDRDLREKALPPYKVPVILVPPQPAPLLATMLVRHEVEIVPSVLTALSLVVSADNFLGAGETLLPPTDPTPKWALLTAGQAAYKFAGGTYDCTAYEPSRGSKGPTRGETDAIIAMVCYAVLKPPTDVNWVGFSDLRTKALNARAGGGLRAEWLNGARSLPKEAMMRIHTAFQSDTRARRFVCELVYRCIVLAAGSTDEAISSQCHLLMGSGVASAMRALEFAVAFPDVVTAIPELTAEASILATMFTNRSNESGVVQAFGGQIYRDAYGTVKSTAAPKLTTISILLERKTKASATNIQTLVKDATQLQACESIAEGLHRRAQDRVKKFLDEATAVQP